MRHLVLFALLVVASADVYYDGPCPPTKPMDNFDFSRYQGTWYQIARYLNAGEGGDTGRCTTAQYLVNGNTGKVRNTHVISGVKTYILGDLKLVEPSVVRITYTFGGRSKHSYLTVLKTDYDNYAIGYSCKYFKDSNTHQVFAFIKSRSMDMDPVSLAIVNDYIESSSLLESDKFFINDYSEPACSYTQVKQIQEFVNI